MGSCEIRDLPTVKNARRILVRPYRGSVVRYKCNRGFHLYGPHLFHCVDHKEWSHLEAPVCASKSNIISLETSNGPASYTVLENHSWKVSFLYNVVWVPERSLQFAKLFLFLILAEGQISQGDWVEAFKWCSFFCCNFLTGRGCDETQMHQIAYGLAKKQEKGAVYQFECDEGAVLAGSPTVFCDGYKWNDTAPTCLSNNL